MKTFISLLLKLTKYFFVVIGLILMAITTMFVFCYYLCETTVEALDLKAKQR